MPGTLGTLRLLARRAVESRGGVGAGRLAQRWHAKTAFVLARQLHALAAGCLGPPRAQHLWPDWAEGPEEAYLLEALPALEGLDFPEGDVGAGD